MTLLNTKDVPSIKITPDNIFFFDMDGTLINTDYANYLSYKEAIQSVTKSNHNLIYNPDQRFNRSNLKNAVPNLTETDYERIVQVKEEYYNDFLYETKLNTEIANILFKYSKTNKTVLVTNCREDRALITLNYHGLTEKFSKLFFRQLSEDDQKINKFQNAVSVLGILPKSVIVFENEQAEIINAQKAGIQIINPLKFI